MGTRTQKKGFYGFRTWRDRPRLSCAEASRYAATCGRDVNGMDQIEPLHKGVRRSIRITFSFLAAGANSPRRGQNTPGRVIGRWRQGRRWWTN